MTTPVPVDDDSGLLRVLIAVPLTLLTLIAGYFCRTALTIRPSGTWDDSAHAAIVLSCVFTIGAAAGSAAMWLAPSVRRAVPWWWACPVVMLGLVATVRWGVGG
ncbi:hypothetical protein ACFV98_12735 [Streptomyces violascens]|uniref:hypothetical protein n=1 Tax=Streptomyces violascens TaxID=67381 RepID=UPI00364A9970